MVRLRLLGVPIEVHLSHLVFMPLVAFFLIEPTGWAAHAPRPLAVALSAVLVSSALLLHELGHALAGRAFGYRPVVQLIGLTGRTLPNPNETIPWQRDVALHLAGPGVGITLGFIALAGYYAARARLGGALEYALLVWASAHLIWAVVNLLPLHPLDGGRVVTAVAMRLFGRDGFLYAQVFGMGVGVALAAAAFAFRAPLGIFPLIYVLHTAVLIAAFRRGELPRQAVHPLELAFARARELYAEEKFEEAQALAEPLLEADLQPELRARVHLLAGWLALKLGLGRRALDHFSATPGGQVPPQAVAAAFSLIGDDARAVPLWEEAAHATGDATLLHEWAGALIRLGRESEARRLPGLHLPAAFEAAQRVPVARGDFASAAKVAEARFAFEPSAANAYHAACFWARADRADDALRLLALAAQHGFADLQRALDDDALSSLRAHAGFGAFLEGLRGSQLPN
ncbi:MAG: peptidase M50 [Archangiaceae bacterium]|nr:peptidase M50 [Archangiaceae bacterium]